MPLQSSHAGRRRLIRALFAGLVGCLLVTPMAQADAPLKSSLDLTVDQAAQVQQIQASYRQAFRAKRQEYNRESRKLRRAKIANDSGAIDQLEQVTSALEAELRTIREAEDAEIRELLTVEQQAKFDQVIEQRRAARGSSRDANVFSS